VNARNETYRIVLRGATLIPLVFVKEVVGRILESFFDLSFRKLKIIVLFRAYSCALRLPFVVPPSIIPPEQILRYTLILLAALMLLMSFFGYLRSRVFSGLRMMVIGVASKVSLTLSREFLSNRSLIDKTLMLITTKRLRLRHLGLRLLLQLSKLLWNELLLLSKLLRSELLRNELLLVNKLLRKRSMLLMELILSRIDQLYLCLLIIRALLSLNDGCLIHHISIVGNLILTNEWSKGS